MCEYFLAENKGSSLEELCTSYVNPETFLKKLTSNAISTLM
jgi:hypothetical protein